MRPLEALVLAIVVYCFFVYCSWRIIVKSGLSKALILLFVVPQLAIIGWGVLAFQKWPAKPSGKVRIYARK